jgi:hypothetical protein
MYPHEKDSVLFHLATQDTGLKVLHAHFVDGF